MIRLVYDSGGFGHCSEDPTLSYYPGAKPPAHDVWVFPKGAAVDGSSSASGASGASGMARGTKNTFPDEVIERLMKIADFSRQQVVEALSVSDGDAERAASYLFSTLNAS